MWTLQAYLFLLILLGGVVIAAGTLPAERSPTEFSDLQRRQLGADVLSAATATGELTDAVLYWNASGDRWVGARGGASDHSYTTLRTQQGHPLWPVVNASLTRRQFGYDLRVEYRNAPGDTEQRTSRQIVYQGPPGQDAVTVSETVVVTDDSVPARAPRSADGDPCTLGEMGADRTVGTNGCTSAAYLAPDAAPESERYNVLEVELTLWSV